MWKQIPSATTGGKPYFYLFYSDKEDITPLATIVWDRVALRYALKWNKNDVLIKQFINVKDAKQFFLTCLNK